MIYFDPLDAEDLARTILLIQDNREVICRRQQAAGQALWQRTWTDVARDWLAVFREAVELTRQKNSSKAA
jgi:hypothetical protein